jgi:zinc/manganese transport system substrate-binding protein
MPGLFALLAAALLTATPTEAAVQVVATTSSMAMLVRTVGGNGVEVSVLAPPDRDAHVLLARPSMMLAVRRADLVVAVGADLEVGWLPAVLQGASNPRVLPGQSGYFEGAAQLVLLEKGQAPDRAGGDVHPAGNPHYYLDPARMALLARALADRLAALDAGGASGYRSRAAGFSDAVAARLPAWRQRSAGAPGVLLYHRDATYLTTLLGVPVRGFIEPVPGVPPTASHLRDLVGQLKASRGVILYTTFQPGDGPEFLSRQLGWPRVQLPLEVPLDADGARYLEHIDRWVNAMAGRAA